MPPELTGLQSLTRHGVPFVVIGGHAVNFHGYRRATEDTDVVWLRSAASEQALLHALGGADARYLGDEIDPATGLERAHAVTLPFIQANRLMMLLTTQGFIDLFDYIPGCPEADVNELFTTSSELAGLKFASLPWLRRMKQAAGRPKDLDDLRNLPE